MNQGVMLNAYPDSLGGSLAAEADVLARPECRGAFRSFYILPSLFNSDLDRGFSVASYDLNRLLADEGSLKRVGELGLDLKLDFVLNHLSVLSPQFQDLLARGDESPYRDFFIDWNRFWAGKGEMTPEGYIQPDPALIQDMFFRKPGLPILMVRMPDGSKRPYWNTFYQEVRYPVLDAQDLMAPCGLQYAQADRLAGRINASVQAGKGPAGADFTGFESCREAAVQAVEARCRYLGQMDLNLKSPLVWEYYRETLKKLAGYGAAIVRLDAFAYAPKEPGRRNFMNEPETWDLLEEIHRMAEPLGLTLLPEIHASYAEGAYRTLTRKGYMTYDFFLPGLVIDAIENHTGEYLARWAKEERDEGIRTVNMLGCHDGIPLLDLKGLLPMERIQALIDLVVSRGGLVKSLHGQKNLYYQVNATYYSALGEDDRKMLLARALQLFMPGKPQVWYLDLFAGRNDREAVARGGEAGHKEINRTNLTGRDIAAGLERPIVRDQLRLMRMRNACGAFEGGTLTVEQAAADRLTLAWERDGSRARLEADLSTYAFRAVTSEGGEESVFEQ